MQSTAHQPQAAQNTWTVLSLLQWATEHLKQKGFDEARLTVELLLAHTLNLTRFTLYTNFDRPLGQDELTAFKSLFKRRLTREPLQYILGETEFMGLKLYVDRRALIPRPETEILVEQTVNAARAIGGKGLRILDIGTGSGNIPVALAHFLPEALITSVDVSAEALELAAGNINRHRHTNVTLRQADILTETFPGQSFNIIVSNPPYIAVAEFPALQPEVKDFEPRIATTDEADGLTYLRHIGTLAKESLVPGGVLLMEIAFNQAPMVEKFLRDSGYNTVMFVNDYAGIQRIAKATS